eukprot:4234-Heterococcus_DN1.PRE.1
MCVRILANSAAKTSKDSSTDTRSAPYKQSIMCNSICSSGAEFWLLLQQADARAYKYACTYVQSATAAATTTCAATAKRWATAVVHYTYRVQLLARDHCQHVALA